LELIHGWVGGLGGSRVLGDRLGDQGGDLAETVEEVLLFAGLILVEFVDLDEEGLEVGEQEVVQFGLVLLQNLKAPLYVLALTVVEVLQQSQNHGLVNVSWLGLGLHAIHLEGGGG
jgi:hypothetical protein